MKIFLGFIMVICLFHLPAHSAGRTFQKGETVMIVDDEGVFQYVAKIQNFVTSQVVELTQAEEVYHIPMEKMVKTKYLRKKINCDTKNDLCKGDAVRLYGGESFFYGNILAIFENGYSYIRVASDDSEIEFVFAYNKDLQAYRVNDKVVFKYGDDWEFGYLSKVNGLTGNAKIVTQKNGILTMAFEDFDKRTSCFQGICEGQRIKELGSNRRGTVKAISGNQHYFLIQFDNAGDMEVLEREDIAK